MNVDHDNCDLASVSNGETFTQLLTQYVTYAAPRLFALCQIPSGGDNESWIFAWGAAFDDSSVLFNPNGKIIGTFTSANSALDLFSRTQKLCLIWVDPAMFHQSEKSALTC
ncbi:MAG: hypothetical protein JO272_04085 [Pseudonocardiales bacterium]|nr:hypothetical protein [Pseudonocardiales bacterium]